MPTSSTTAPTSSPAAPHSTCSGMRAETVSGEPIDAGHFLPEEYPAATAEALLAFFNAG
jgi:hypothetical protein